MRRARTSELTSFDALAHLRTDHICSLSFSTEPFPVDLEWEMLSDVIRGNVKINVHSYQVRR